MSKQQDLDRLGHAIKDAEARLRVFSQTLDAIEKELTDLTALQTTLQENVSFLKKQHIIALAAQYKKAKEDLARAMSRMIKVRIDRDNVLRAAKEVEEYLHKARTEQVNALKGPNNILAFRRKDAKE